MPATTVMRELFPKATTTLAQVKARQDLAIKAGAIRSWDRASTTLPKSLIWAQGQDLMTSGWVSVSVPGK